MTLRFGISFCLHEKFQPALMIWDTCKWKQSKISAQDYLLQNFHKVSLSTSISTGNETFHAIWNFLNWLTRQKFHSRLKFFIYSFSFSDGKCRRLMRVNILVPSIYRPSHWSKFHQILLNLGATIPNLKESRSKLLSHWASSFSPV